ncbi:MAG: CDP-glucose 4,6-dehydratase [Bacteroidales bacterium]|jgi:CDP-glucose 4,6-dehydratase|nr:CDP-glucose 4,6-dehydratase [Bacteroidales bacterium]
MSNLRLFGNIYRDKKILVTGNTGFKGSWLCTWLIFMGAKVYGIAKDIPTNPSVFEELRLSERIVHFTEDIRHYERLRNIINDIAPDFIFHLAAQAIVSRSYQDPLNTISSNVIGTTNLLEALRNYEKPCVAVIITSDKCYDNVEWVWGYKETDVLGGKDIYSGSKGAAELIFKSYFYSFFKEKKPLIKIATARAGNVIGGGDWALDRIVPDCMRSWNMGKTVEIRNPKATRPWQHVLEPLSGYLLLGQCLCNNEKLNGESFNFGPSSEYSHTVQDILEYMSIRWHFDDSDKAYHVTGDIPFHEAGLLKLNCDKALFHLHWLPTLDYEKLLNYTSDWYYEYYKNKSDMLDYSLSQIQEYIQLAVQKGRTWTK